MTKKHSAVIMLTHLRGMIDEIIIELTNAILIKEDSIEYKLSSKLCHHIVEEIKLLVDKNDMMDNEDDENG